MELENVMGSEVAMLDDVVAALEAAAGEWSRQVVELREAADRLEAKAATCRSTVAELLAGLAEDTPDIPAAPAVPGPPPAPEPPAKPKRPRKKAPAPVPTDPATTTTTSTPPASSSVKAGRPRSGGVPPLEEVAAVANAAIEAGQLPVGALVEHYRKLATTVRNWLYRARQAHLVATWSGSGLKVVEDHTVPATPVPMPELQLVADTYVEAVTVGRKPIQTIVDRFDATRDQAHEWVALARAGGLLPPRDEPQVQGRAPEGAADPPGEDRMTVPPAPTVHGLCFCCDHPIFSALLDGRRVVVDRPPTAGGRLFVRFDLATVTAVDRGPAIDLTDPHDDGTRHTLHTCPERPPRVYRGGP